MHRIRRYGITEFELQEVAQVFNTAVRIVFMHGLLFLVDKFDEDLINS